ncbi:DNA N-glycosylase and apurinic/apyrimidinic (AP) lyase [Zygosaccharomyces mellis]|uniref:Endonuclease III homolog n=1 Tax=Zygosaccharomyces mellis TaxID=42258 RepID=A0A4C2E1K7_9SACH|nr:DNA N-glycosylase and apurinic/apyrimidinic (AP) lyase [Zygosaccharomyces mellis]
MGRVKRDREHVEVSIEGAEVKSKYFEKKPKLISRQANPDIDYIKSLDSEAYFQYITELTDDSPERWSRPLDSSIFVSRPGCEPLPSNFKTIYCKIRLMRSKLMTPVDTVGCASLPVTVSGSCGIGKVDIEPKNYRLQLLTALMLSSQTKDEVTAQAMQNIMKYSMEEFKIPQGITLETLLRVHEGKLDELVKSVGFHTRKAKYVKQMAQILVDLFDSDIPTDLPGILSLPGVGPKMGILALQKAWGRMDGIGVDLHVDRLCKMWGWVDAKKCKTPEHTRKQLETWLPRELWYEINPLLVGFGQVICMSRGKRCDLCLANDVCNAVDPKIMNKKAKNEERATRGDFSQWLEYWTSNKDDVK